MAKELQTRYLTAEECRKIESAVESAGFAVDEFTHGWIVSKKTRDLRVSCIKHFDCGSFTFDWDGGHRASMRLVGGSSRKLKPRIWSTQLKSFHHWLTLLKQEVERRVEAALEMGDIEAEREQRAFQDYDGNTYLVDGWVADGDSFEQAKKRVQDPDFLVFWLRAYFGKKPSLTDLRLAQILKDQYATEALCEAVTGRNREVLRALADYAKQITPRGKPGPRPNKEGRYRYEVVADLHISKGLSHGQIGLSEYGDPERRNRSSALLSIYRKKTPSGSKK